MSDPDKFQQELTRIALEILTDEGFALAGSGAIREHGITNRPTQDIDLFTDVVSPEVFTAATTKLAEGLTERGYAVFERRRAEQFARFEVASSAGRLMELDLAGVSWLTVSRSRKDRAKLIVSGADLRI